MQSRILLGGGAFLEGPRWRGDKLWFSDMHGGQIMTVDINGCTEVIANVPQRPSGPRLAARRQNAGRFDDRPQAAAHGVWRVGRTCGSERASASRMQ